MMISILGCGWFGLPLGKTLVKKGFAVKGSTTSPLRFDDLETAGITPYVINLSPDDLKIDDDFFECETLLICIPPKFRSGIFDEYIAKIQTVITYIIKHEVKQVIYVSSTGVYPDSNVCLTEQVEPEPITPSGKTLLQAEQLLGTNASFKTAIIRFGGLVGPGRNPGKFFAGKTSIPNGQAPVNLIHLDDCIGITEAILEKSAFGHVLNAAAPHHPNKKDFYTAAAQYSGLQIPDFIDELQEWKIVDSEVISTLLAYKLKRANWFECLEQDCFKS